MAEIPSENLVNARPHRVLQILPHLIHGGTELYVLRMASELDDGRFDFCVCYLGQRADIARLYREKGLSPIPIGHHGPLDAIRTIVRLVKLIRRLRTNVIQTHSRLDRLYGHVAALITGVPVVDTLHSHWSAARYAESPHEASRISTNKLRLKLEEWLSRKTVMALIAVSETVVDTWAQSGSTRDRNVRSISVVPPVIDFSRYLETLDPTEVLGLRHQLGLVNVHPLLVTVGRLVKGKNHEALVPLVGRLKDEWPNLGLLVVGDGPTRASLAEKIDQSGLADRVILLGSRDDVPHLLAVGDVFVLASQTEGLGIAAIEAVAAGLPVVSFDLPSLRSVLVDGMNARLAAPGDNEDLIRQMQLTLRHLAEMKEQALRIRSRVRLAFESRTVADRLDAAYSLARGYS